MLQCFTCCCEAFDATRLPVFDGGSTSRPDRPEATETWGRFRLPWIHQSGWKLVWKISCYAAYPLSRLFRPAIPTPLPAFHDNQEGSLVKLRPRAGNGPQGGLLFLRQLFLVHVHLQQTRLAFLGHIRVKNVREQASKGC